MVAGGTSSSRRRPRAKKKALADFQFFNSFTSERLTTLPEAFLGSFLAEALPGCTSTTAGSLSIFELHEIAHLILDTHGDRWTVDFLSAPIDRSANCALSHAIEANERGEPEIALSAATQASALFGHHGNPAGDQRAILEQVFALHRMYRAHECLDTARDLSRGLTGRDYPWIKGQLALEISTCEGFLGKIGDAKRDSTAGIDIATSAKLEVLRLRGLGMNAELDAATGFSKPAWSTTMTGLDEFWAGHFPPIRAYQFYAGIAYAAERSQQWDLAAALNREALPFITATPNKSVQAMALYRLGTDELMAGETGNSSLHIQQADALFALLPRSNSWAVNRAYGETVRAGLQVHRGDVDRAIEIINDNHHALAQTSDFILPLLSFSAEAEANLRQHKVQTAEDAYAKAIRISEKAESSLRTDADHLAWDYQLRDLYRSVVRIEAREKDQPLIAAEIWRHYREIESEEIVGHAATPGKEGSLVSPLPKFADASVLSYVVYSDGVAEWLYDNRGEWFQWVSVPLLDLEHAIARFKTLCADPGSDQRELIQVSRQLYDWLIAPLQSHVEPKRELLVEPDGDIASIPFVALRDMRGRWLPVRSVRLILGAANPSLGEARLGDLRSLHAMIIGGPSLTDRSGKAPLPDAKAEADSVASHFNNPMVFTGRGATLQAITNHLAQSELVHFAGHADRQGDETALQLSARDGGTAEYFSRKNLSKGKLRNCRLFVMAGCATLGRFQGDDLAGALLKAGVARVIATEWNIDSEATKSLVGYFYDAMSSGKNVDEALHLAQLRVRSSTGFNHPYYWAGVVSVSNH